ncbi:phospholipase D-like domain-containing protein [Planctomycetes bacterium K23_9]|uniref:Major cardiolipin synthase ClsA n=1 Tax=Stieleria marina TaxID=1930275 RepID=A0A517NQ07_9BACT|nr:Major cardiolipin synthase ClsA [Planctomycetes bacterium K23_9]
MIRPAVSVGSIIEASSATEFTALWDRDAEWDRRIEMIATARSFLHLSTLYVEWDEVGREALAELLKAQQRGVATILLIDRFGQRLGGYLMTRTDRARLRDKLNELRRAGGQVVMYSPKHVIDRYVGCGHHIKIQLSDRGEAIFGSSNLSRSSFKEWNEFSVALRGPIVDVLSRNFNELLGSSVPASTPLPSKPSLPSQNIPMDYWSYNPTEDPCRWGAFHRCQTNPLTAMLADKIRNAQHTIRLTSFYYKPARVIVEALKEATSRGVTVDIFHSNASSLNTPLPWLAAATGYESLVRQGANIYENQHGEHSKIILIDDKWTAFGSYNFEDAADSRWAEAMLTTKDPSILAVIRAIFQGLDSDPDNELVTAEELNKWPLMQRVSTKLFRPIKGWF